MFPHLVGNCRLHEFTPQNSYLHWKLDNRTEHYWLGHNVSYMVLLIGTRGQALSTSEEELSAGNSDCFTNESICDSTHACRF